MAKQFACVCAVLLLVASCFGCAATIGHDFKVDTVSKFQVGRTSEAEVIALMGSQPTHRQTHLTQRPDIASWKEGDYYLAWMFSKGTSFDELTSRYLLVLFDSNKVLKEVIAQSNMSDNRRKSRSITIP